MKSNSKIFILVLFLTIITTINSYAQGNNFKFKVVLDAGHGGHDFGATYHGFIEKKIALAIVLKVGKILEQDPSVEVKYTRHDDTFIDLVERANIANRNDANFFVSVHCNANKNTTAFGSETFVMGLSKSASSLAIAKKENDVITLEDNYKSKYKGYDPNSPESLISATLAQEEYLDQSIELAHEIQNTFEDKLGRKNRGVEQAGFMVLHKAFMPRVLIETGFISNKEEGSYLNSEEGQNNIAKAIAEAIFKMKVAYFGGTMPIIEVEKTEKPAPINESPKEIDKNSSNSEQTIIKPLDDSLPIYKIQIKASKSNIPTNSANFKGLKEISSIKENGYYKYLYGGTNDYVVAKIQLLEAKTRGYDGAFIVAFKSNKKISLNEALKK
jgi:N-acetylmuramoyl-L-alanine amidase